MDKDDSLVVDPTELEYYQKLLEEEKKAVQRAKEMKGSLYPGREMILEMADMYLKYLKLRVDKMVQAEKNKELTNANSITIQGPVGQVIGKVDNLTIKKDN